LKRLSDQTLYEILEVSVDASPEEIERAYERSAALYGPGSLATYSLVTQDEAQLLNNRIEEAKAVLLDADARGRYDERIGVRQRAAATSPATAPMPMSMPMPMSAPAPAPVAAPTPLPTPVAAATPWPPPPPAGPAAATPAATPIPVQLEVLAEASPAPVEALPEPPPLGQLPIALGTPISMPPHGALEPGPVEPQPGTPASPGAAALTASPAGAGPVPPAPIPLKNELPAPRELLVPEGAAWTGEMLRQVREARGLTLPQLSERTKVTRHHLENIETDRFQALPAPVYLRGILMGLARELRLDGQKVSRSYLERQAAAQVEVTRK
jgi:hypothetical protein